MSKKKKKSQQSHSETVTNENTVIHCNIVNNNYHQDSGVLYTFVPNKPLVQLLDI